MSCKLQETSIKCSALVPTGCGSACLQVASALAQLPALRQLAPKPVAAVDEADAPAEAAAPAGDAPSAQGGSSDSKEEEEDALSIDSGSGSDSDDDEAAEVATISPPFVWEYRPESAWRWLGEEGSYHKLRCRITAVEGKVAHGAMSLRLPCHCLIDSFFQSAGNGEQSSMCTSFFVEED